MRRYFLQRAVSRASRRTVAFSKSKSGSQRPTSKFQLGKKASTAARRKPGTRFDLWSRLNESCKCKYFGFAMTLLLFTGAVVMVILYFHKQRKMMGKSDAIAVIREFMILQNKSFQGKTDSEILEGAQRLAEYLLQLKSRNEEIEKETNNIIQKLIDRWKPFLGNLYYFSSTTQPADYAKYYCEKYGGNLVDVTSREEEVSSMENLKGIFRERSNSPSRKSLYWTLEVWNPVAVDN